MTNKTDRNLADFVVRIKELTEIDVGNSDLRYGLQDIMIGGKEWNDFKSANHPKDGHHTEIQDFETLMYIFFLKKIDRDENKEVLIMRLMNIFINIFQLNYMDTMNIPDIFADKRDD